MLELKGIVKDYVSGETVVHALKGVNLAFRKTEFISILGPSGCGKTTMLNILGGLDKYTDGDLIINGKSTKHFTASDWDAYRNRCVGFVFQSYNLISHLSILANVEMALTLSGISRQERVTRAKEALEKVGLGEIVHKRPNQLSGGQMQRVAIARAIVNDPEIIMADEPTGALDSKTSVQIADLLKEISKDKLVVMVTHNDKLAEDYSTRIIKMKDGEIIGDTDPYEAPPYVPTQAEIELEKMLEEFPVPEQGELDDKVFIKEVKKAENKRASIIKKQERKMANERKAELNKTSMGPITALKLAFKNLMTKKGRSIMVSVASSIGIIGVALVLAVSNGFSGYMHRLETDTLSGFPISIQQYSTDIEKLMSANMSQTEIPYDKFPNDGKLNIYQEKTNNLFHYNKITEEYVRYVSEIDKSLVNDISYTYGMSMNILSKNSDGYSKVNTSPADMISSMLGASGGGYWQELLPNKNFIETQYQVIEGNYPSLVRKSDGTFDIAMVVDQYNRISTTTLEQLGLSVNDITNATLSELIGKELRWIPNNEWYKKVSGKQYYEENGFESYAKMYENGITLRVSGVLRINETTPVSLYKSGVVYPTCLTDYVRENSKASQIGIDQANKNIVVLPQSMLPKGTEKILFPGSYIPSGEIPLGDYSFSGAQLKEMLMQSIGAGTVPTGISIYPASFESKDDIVKYLNDYNIDKTEKEKVLIFDAASIATATMSMLIDTISIVLVAFAAISLVVSSLMIAIIMYTSVIERTKEIGILRSLGARKKDISRLFNAETIAIGFFSGLLGVIVAVILSFPLNAVLVGLAGGMVTGSLVALSPLSGFVLILVSMLLTFVAGYIPAILASKKDPVKALRTE